MDSGRFASELFIRFMPWWAWIIAAIGVVGIFLGLIFDLRIALMALMVVLIIMPMIIGLLYYVHALSRECFINRLAHTVAVRDNNLIVTLYIREAKDNEAEQSADNPTDSKKEKEPGKDDCRTREEVFTPREIKGWELKPSGGYISLAGKNKGFLYVPFDAFDDDGDFKELGEWVDRIKTS